MLAAAEIEAAKTFYSCAVGCSTAARPHLLFLSPTGFGSIRKNSQRPRGTPSERKGYGPVAFSPTVKLSQEGDYNGRHYSSGWAISGDPRQPGNSRYTKDRLRRPLGLACARLEDLWIAPQISLAYGAVFAAFAYAAALQLTRLNALPFLLPLAFGFLLIGPILAAGFYEIGRRHERGEAITLRGIALAVWARKDQLASFGLLLLVLYLFWIDVAFLLFMLFFGRPISRPSANLSPRFWSPGLAKACL